MQFLDSNLFQTIIILVTALFVFVVYAITRRNFRQETATILLNEIRFAEHAIDEIRRNKEITELNSIMPVNSWIKHKHMFVKRLNIDEFNLVNEFYNRCEYAEKYRQLLFDTFNCSVLEKAKFLQGRLIDFMVEDIKKSSNHYDGNKTKLIAMANKEDWIFTPTRPITTMIEYIQNIQLLMLTSCGLKLKRIARYHD